MRNPNNATFFDFRFSKRNKKKLLKLDIFGSNTDCLMFTDKLSEIILDFQVWKPVFHDFLFVAELLIISLASQPQKSNRKGKFHSMYIFLSV
jgi:hypothetical protein